MDPEIKEFLTAFFGEIWKFFTNVPIPYFNITFAQLFIGLFASSAFIAFIHKTLDSNVDNKSGRGDYAYQEKEDE